MSVRHIIRTVALSALLGSVTTLSGLAQSLTADGKEYAIVGSYLGDQLFPAVSYSGSKGFLVWEDNHVDGHGVSVAARQLSSGFSADISPAFRVNTLLDGDHRHPKVALLAGGNVAFAWQGGKEGSQRIYCRLLNPSGAFYGKEQLLSQPNVEALDASLGSLPDGSAVVVWSAFGVDGDLSGVFLRTLSGDGSHLGPIVQVNQFTPYNQRNAEAAVLSDGRIVVTWVSEQQRSVASEGKSLASCDVNARVFGSGGQPLANEFRLNTEDRICANPVVAATANGGVAFAWTQRAPMRSNGWDVVATWYGPLLNRTGIPIVVNSTTVGDQVLPSIATLGERQMVAWISSPIVSSRSVIVGQVFQNATKLGGEVVVNTWTSGKQNQPVIASDDINHFSVIWSTFTGMRGYDLHAQRFALAGALPIPEAPYVASLSQDALQATWAPVLGYALKGYEIRFDGNDPFALSQSVFNQKGLQPSSAHEFRIRYVLTTGEASAWSKPGLGRTWGEDANFDGLPDDWQELYWGPDSSLWPSASADSDGDGASNAREFFAGTDPTDVKSILRQTISHKGSAVHIEWNTIAGLVYQVQRSENLLPLVWNNLNEPRLARSTSDSLTLPKDGRGALYRVIRIR